MFLLAFEVGNQRINRDVEWKPGAKWRACRKEMIERVLDMHQTDLALKAFKEEGV